MGLLSHAFFLFLFSYHFYNAQFAETAFSIYYYRRFITLVDEMYNMNRRLVCSSVVPLSNLFDDTIKQLNDREVIVISVFSHLF